MLRQIEPRGPGTGPWLAAWLSGYHVGIWPADFAWPESDLWLTGNRFVGKLSAKKANSAFHPSGGLWTWRRLNGSQRGRAWLRPRLYDSSVCDAQQYAACGAIQIRLFSPFIPSVIKY